MFQTNHAGLVKFIQNKIKVFNFHIGSFDGGLEGGSAGVTQRLVHLVDLHLVVLGLVVVDHEDVGGLILAPDDVLDWEQVMT